MKYAIVYSSMTGNTAALADKLHDMLPKDNCVYFGDTNHFSRDLGADLILVGFWTDKESCDDKTRIFLKSLHNTNIVLFGTAGYVDPEYKKTILKNAESNIPVNNTVLDGFVCQGKMKPEVKDKFAAFLAREPENETMKFLMNAYEEGLSHPNDKDFADLKKWVGQYLHG